MDDKLADIFILKQKKGTIANNASTAIPIEFLPVIPTTYEGFITLNTNIGNYVVSLTGSGAEYKILLPEKMDVGTLGAGHPEIRTCIVSNPTELKLKVLSQAASDLISTSPR